MSATILASLCFAAAALALAAAAAIQVSGRAHRADGRSDEQVERLRKVGGL